MSHYDKNQSSLPAEESGPGVSSASLRKDFRKQDCTPELHGLIDLLGEQRKKILANVVLAGWVSWDAWILCGLLIILALSVRLAPGTILALALSLAGAVFLIAWAWRARLSTYQTAQRLDTAANLQDRISTAIYLGDQREPGEIIARQRKDALARLCKVDLVKMFPLQIPKGARRGGALLLAVFLLFVYRIHHRPPVIALLQTMARSPLLQSVVSPLVNALEKDLERAAALVTSNPDSLADQAIPAMSNANSDLWQSSNDKADAKEGQQDSMDASAGDMPEDQMQPGDQNQKSSDSRQPENSADQSQDAGNSGENSSDQAQKQSDSRGSQKPGESLSQSLMQALKNMMSKSPSQQNNRDKAPNSDGAPQSGNSNQSGNNDSDKKGDSHGTSDAKDKQSQSASSGAGSQPGLKELQKAQMARQVQAVPDRVALEASGFKDPTRMRVDAETGTSQLALRNQQSQSEAVINGAEEESIPPRYRLYVQRYFEHADSQKR